MRTGIFIFSIILILGCKKKNDFSPVYNVPPQFESYIGSFIAEAAARGHHITVNNLIIQFDSSLSVLYCAKSNVISSQNNIQKIISLNPTLKCWLNNTQLETIIFHEMGHCLLGRDHDTGLLPKGYPRSLMYPNDITLYSSCIYAVSDSCDKLYRRGYYLDELFDPATPVPDWGK